MALSSTHGIFVAANTRTPVSSCPTPFICTKNSVLIRREPSDSPSPREPANESSSSMKMIDGFDSRAIWNNCFTNLNGFVSQQRRVLLRGHTHRSESPCHLLTKSEELILKNVLLASVATAFAR
jgi:hypothetical protein